MRILCFSGIALVAALINTSCTEDMSGSDLDRDGLTPEVRQFVPAEVIDGLKEIGHPIYGGVNPPLLNGDYLLAPMLLSGTNLPLDTTSFGTPIRNQTMTFFEQTADMEIGLRYLPVNESLNTATRSLIVGEDCRFTVFSEFDYVAIAGETWSIMMVTSGCLDVAGIQDIAVSYLLSKDPDEVYAAWRVPGQGRMFTDGDGLAERQ